MHIYNYIYIYYIYVYTYYICVYTISQLWKIPNGRFSKHPHSKSLGLRGRKPSGSGERRAPQAGLCPGLPGSCAETTQGLGLKQARHGHHAPWRRRCRILEWVKYHMVMRFMDRVVFLRLDGYFLSSSFGKNGDRSDV